jgi:hypothetical protein
MHYGSGSGSGTGIGSGFNIKCKKVKKITNERQTFCEIMLLLTLTRHDFAQIFVVGKKNCAKYVCIRNWS